MTTLEAIITAVLGLLASGGGAKFFLDWLSRRQKAQHEHEVARDAGYDAHQTAFLDALKTIQSKFLDHQNAQQREFLEREDVRRDKHLTDARAFAESNREMAARLTQTLDRLESRRPPKGEP